MKKILVMSGKGGVGKTTISVSIAVNLSKKGYKVGILDVDMHGPNVLKMFNYKGPQIIVNNDKMVPINIEGIEVCSIAGMIDNEKAIIWRGPRKHGAINQLVNDTAWGDLDYLVVDFPPGTGDEHLSSARLLSNNSGVILVSAPQSVSVLDLKRSIDFCEQMNLNIIGVVENMSGDIFGSGKVKKTSQDKNLNFITEIPLKRDIAKLTEEASYFTQDSKTDEYFTPIIDEIEKFKF